MGEAFAGMTRASERVGRAAATAADRTAGAYRRNARGLRDESVRASRESEAAANRAVQAYVRGEEQKRRAARLSADARQRAEYQATAIARAEASKRGLSAEQESRVRQQALERMTRSYETHERRVSAAVRRERVERERAERAETSSRERGSRAGAGAARSVAEQGAGFAGSVHTAIQTVREQRAARETALNNILLQLVPSGAGAGEIAGLRSQIMQGALAARLDPDAVIEAVGGAQSFANALGGDTAAQRRANTAATLRDVEFASVIDPTSMGGLVRLGALARGRMGDRDRRDLLRSFAGISFQGSVETDQAITQGLPGLMEAWSTATAGVNDPGEASARRLEVARDFAAQIQSQAASGRSVTVSANRTNTVRNALANAHRQDELGRAFAARERSMTAEQRAAFSSTFTRDASGHYRMSEAVRGRASDAARFFGTMFGNDAGAMRNFLGAHGGGGAHQLMNRPDVDALASYFGTATNARGEQVRQYDYVNELARSTITPEQEATMRSVREAEDSRTLTAAREAGAAALGDNTTALNRLSDALANWSTAHPLQSMAGTALAGILGPAAAGRVGAWFGGTNVGRALAPGGGGVRAALTVARGGGLLSRLGGAALGVPGMLAAGLSAIGAYGGTSQEDVEQQRREGAEWARQSARLGGEARAAGRAPPTAAEIGAAVAAALRTSPLTATVTPTDAAQAASRAPAPGR